MEHSSMNTNLSMRQATSPHRHPAITMAMLALSALLVFGARPFGLPAQKAEAASQRGDAARTTQQRPLPCGLTLDRTEGPFWRARSPERSSLIEPGMLG